MKQDTRKAYRSRAAATERMIDDAVAALKAELNANRERARNEVAEAEANRVHLTRDDLLAATYVRTRFGWHKVARVSRTTVSVETGYSWTDKYEFSKILEARTIT